MSPGSNRKKPVCQKCGEPMAGHKRPHGIPVCPREGSQTRSPSRPYSPARASELPDGPPTPTGSPPPPLVGSYIKKRIPSPDFTVDPTASGYWHRSNPNWVNHHAAQLNPLHTTPPRGGSWVSTETDSGSHGSPGRRRALPPARHEVIDVDAVEGPRGRRSQGGGGAQEARDEHAMDITSDTQSNVSQSPPPSIIKSMSRGLSMVVGRGSPLASLYSTPREEVTAITSAAQAKGLYTRVFHNDNKVKSEPITPTRVTPSREYSWMVAVGRDRSTVDALVDAQTPRKPPRELLMPDEQVACSTDRGEPYNFERGLDRERNESVGTYPVDPRGIRNTFLDTLLAGAIGGLVMFYCLSSV